MKSLDELVKEVHDERTFVRFLEALGRDFAKERAIEEVKPSAPYGPGALGWENSTVDQVLESAVAWARDTTDNPVVGPVEPNPWRRCAWILFAGKFYE